MAIEYLKLRGFKSFGRQCDFEFSKNFTAIVGPNGSGKSNILDALKWILGEGSAAGLRITRQSDLLFQGSASTSPAKNCEIILRLANENAKQNLRRVYSNENGSVLFLDNKKILLSDLDSVKEKFSLEGEGFALIGQGEISQTIHQRPKERRRQLDALFGIERYREKRDDSMKKLEDAQTESQRIETLIQELQTRREEISEDVGVAVQAQGIIDELENLRRDYYFFRRYTLENQDADLNLQRHIVASKLEDLENWARIWTLGRKFYEEKLSADTSRNFYTQKLENISSQKNVIQRKAFQLATQVKDIKARRANLGAELDTLQIQSEALTQERERTKNEHEKISRELEDKQKEFSAREKVFKEAQAQTEREKARRKKILDDIANIKLRRSRNEAEISALENNTEDVSALENERDEKSHAIENLTVQKNNLEEKFTRLTFSSQQQTSKVQALRRELSHLESQQSNFFSSGNYPEPVRIILAAAEKNILQSKPITFADAFSCSSSEVAEAIEAYLGGRQYYLLVRSLEEAQEGINFLKENRAGRVTYLALERCRPKEKNSRLSFGQGVTGWAMDLIIAKSEWRDAISHVMGDLLIVEDYDTASKIIRAGVKFPVATFDGEVFAPSGTISGGAARQKSGAVVARQKLEELQENISGAKIRLVDAVEQEQKFRRDFENVSGELENVKSNLQDAQRNLNAITRNIERIKNEREKSRLHSEKLRAELEEFSKNLERLEKELKDFPDIHEENYDAVITPLKNEIRLLQERLNVTRALYERVDGEFMNVQSRIKKAGDEIALGKNIEAQNRKTLYELSREKVKAHHEELDIRREIEKHNDEFLSVRKKIDAIRAKLERSGEKILSVKNNLSEVDNKISHVNNEISQLAELWEEKYPYDKREAKSIERGKELTSSLRKLERELKSLSAYNLGALSEDQSLTERIDFLSEQLEDVNVSASELKALINDTDMQVEKSFTSSMSRIDERFNNLFGRLFGGGEARLILQDGESIWDRGVEIFARPPGKKLQNISQLSGGEQSLTSIALIFATLEAAGTPLAVLDEVDAALDEYNLIRFADLAKEYSQSIQIIAMTHRRATMERANLIYGVTMIEPGLSATVGINPENYE